MSGKTEGRKVGGKATLYRSVREREQFIIYIYIYIYICVCVCVCVRAHLCLLMQT